MEENNKSPNLNINLDKGGQEQTAPAVECPPASGVPADGTMVSAEPVPPPYPYINQPVPGYGYNPVYAPVAPKPKEPFSATRSDGWLALAAIPLGFCLCAGSSLAGRAGGLPPLPCCMRREYWYIPGSNKLPPPGKSGFGWALCCLPAPASRFGWWASRQCRGLCRCLVRPCLGSHRLPGGRRQAIPPTYGSLKCVAAPR